MPKRGGSRGRKKPSLYLLTREVLTQPQLKEYFDELYGTSERTSALVAASALDQLLVQLLQTKFIEMGETELNEIFYGPRAVLGGFSERIILCHALGIVSDATKADLDIIRRVRNAFAHRVQSLSFEHHLIKAECLKLKRVDAPTLAATSDTARRRYVNCALGIANELSKLLLQELKRRNLVKALNQKPAPSSQ